MWKSPLKAFDQSRKFQLPVSSALETAFILPKTASQIKLKAVRLSTIMEFLAFIIWFLLALAIPLILIVISGYKYTRQENVSKVIFRFFIAIVAYTPLTFFVLIFFGAVGNAIAHRKATSSGEILFCFAMVFIYAVIGWLLCVFVNGGFIKPWLIFSEKHNKPQSIFDE